MATVLLVLGAAAGMVVIAVLGGRLWLQIRRLRDDVAVTSDEMARSSSHIAGLLGPGKPGPT
jgi:hypothetical protein